MGTWYKHRDFDNLRHILQIFLDIPSDEFEDIQGFSNKKEFSKLKDFGKITRSFWKKESNETKANFIFLLVFEAISQELELSISQEYGDNWKEIVKQRLKDRLGVEKRSLERLQNVLAMFWETLELVNKRWFVRCTYKHLVGLHFSGWRNWENNSRKELCAMFFDFFLPKFNDFDEEKSE